MNSCPGAIGNEYSSASAMTTFAGVPLADDIGAIYFAPWHRIVLGPRYCDDRILGDRVSVRPQHLRQLPGMAEVVAGQNSFSRLELQPVLPLGQRHSSFIVGRRMGLRNRAGLHDRLDCGFGVGDHDRVTLAFGGVRLTY